jgi:pyruvate dehydrogenase E2 component (dihydrolipoamide acetyltransferase)
VERWYVKEGDRVEAGAPLVAIVTSKAAFDVDAEATGAVAAILAPAGSAVPTGFVLGILVGDGGDPAEALKAARAENERLVRAFRAEAGAGAGRGAGARLKATPAARRLARRESVDLGDVPPGAEHGVIREEDVARFLQFRRES